MSEDMDHIHQGSSAPAQFLVDNVELLPKGRVLDVAMGIGQNAIYLARRGFVVEGVDMSSDAVHSALASAKEFNVTINVKIADLERDYHMKKDAYDLIICFYYLHRELIPQIKDGLRQGGMVVYETFIVDQAQFGKPKNPDYLLHYNELLNMFRDFRCLRYREGVIEHRKAIASIIAQKI